MGPVFSKLFPPLEPRSCRCGAVLREVLSEGLWAWTWAAIGGAAGGLSGPGSESSRFSLPCVDVERSGGCWSVRKSSGVRAVKVILPAFPYVRLRPIPHTPPPAQVLHLVTRLRNPDGSLLFLLFMKNWLTGPPFLCPSVSLPWGRRATSQLRRKTVNEFICARKVTSSVS